MFRKKRVYLDAAAAAPILRSIEKAFVESLALYGNPSAFHREGKRAHDLLEKSRSMLALQFGVKKEAVIFTGTATEANALAILGHVRALQQTKKPENIHILYSPVSHASVVETMNLLRGEGCQVEELILTDHGISPETLREQIRKETVLISVDAICGETGTVLKTREIRRVISSLDEETRPLLHVDASQAVIVENTMLQHSGADMLTFDAQKIGAVRGIGVLIAPRSIPLVPLYGGGGQERGLRSGTVSPALAYACALAVGEAQQRRDAFVMRSLKHKKMLLTGLAGALPTLLVNGGKETTPHILNVSCPGYDTDYLVAVLDELGCAVSTKSACETDEVGSRVVLAFTGDAKRAQETLRISFHYGTTAKDIRLCIKAFSRALKILDGA